MGTHTARTTWYWIGLAVGSALAVTIAVLILTGVLGAFAWFAVAAIVVIAASQFVAIRKEHRRRVRS